MLRFLESLGFLSNLVSRKTRRIVFRVRSHFYICLRYSDNAMLVLELLIRCRLAGGYRGSLWSQGYRGGSL